MCQITWHQTSCPLKQYWPTYLPELVYWASLGEVAEVEKSLANGVDVNQTDEEGYSALHAAAENGYLDVVKLLVEKGADVQHKTQYTALELAEMAGNEDVIIYLKSL
jgi:ankyrin repeat protein